MEPSLLNLHAYLWWVMSDPSPEGDGTRAPPVSVRSIDGQSDGRHKEYDDVWHLESRFPHPSCAGVIFPFSVFSSAKIMEFGFAKTRSGNPGSDLIENLV